MDVDWISYGIMYFTVTVYRTCISTDTVCLCRLHTCICIYMDTGCYINTHVNKKETSSVEEGDDKVY